MAPVTVQRTVGVPNDRLQTSIAADRCQCNGRFETTTMSVLTKVSARKGEPGSI